MTDDWPPVVASTAVGYVLYHIYSLRFMFENQFSPISHSTNYYNLPKHRIGGEPYDASHIFRCPIKMIKF